MCGRHCPVNGLVQDTGGNVLSPSWASPSWASASSPSWASASSPSWCSWWRLAGQLEGAQGWWGRGGKSKWLREKMTNDKKSSRLKILLFIMAGEHFKANDTNHQLERCRKRLRHRRQIQENCSIFLGSPGEKTFLHPQGKYLQVRGSCSAILATVPALRTAGPSLPLASASPKEQHSQLSSSPLPSPSSSPSPSPLLHWQLQQQLCGLQGGPWFRSIIVTAAIILPGFSKFCSRGNHSLTLPRNSDKL